MTVCNQNRVHCGLLETYIDDLSTKNENETTEEHMVYLQGLYHLNGCDQRSIGADEIKHLVEKGKFYVYFLLFFSFFRA